VRNGPRQRVVAGAEVYVPFVQQNPAQAPAQPLALGKSLAAASVIRERAAVLEHLGQPLVQPRHRPADRRPDNGVRQLVPQHRFVRNAAPKVHSNDRSTILADIAGSPPVSERRAVVAEESPQGRPIREHIDGDNRRLDIQALADESDVPLGEDHQAERRSRVKLRVEPNVLGPDVGSRNPNRRASGDTGEREREQEAGSHGG
jgi:hypothetical protein